MSRKTKKNRSKIGPFISKTADPMFKDGFNLVKTYNDDI